MVDWLTIGASVGFSVIGSVLLTEYRLRREQAVEESAELESWYAESASYAAEVRRVWQRLFDNSGSSGGNLSEIQGEMRLLEGQISRHASNGEQLDADEEVIEALDDLAVECRRPTERTLHLNSGSDFAEFREEILATVEDLEDALNHR